MVVSKYYVKKEELLHGSFLMDLVAPTLIVWPTKNQEKKWKKVELYDKGKCDCERRETLYNIYKYRLIDR